MLQIIVGDGRIHRKVVSLIFVAFLIVGVVSPGFLVRDAHASDTIIDTHGDSRFTKYPSGPYWWSRSDSGAYSGNFWYTYCNYPGQTEYFGDWAPSISGEYDVSVWIPNPVSFSGYVPTHNARYQVYYQGNRYAEISVNQASRLGGWYSLGSFTFDTSSFIILNDNTYEPYASTMVAFDAIKFKPVVTPRTLTVYSSPSGVSFTADGASHSTPWSGTYSQGTSINLVMPSVYSGSGARYEWYEWSDGVSSSSRTIVLNSDTTVTGTYIGPYYQLSVSSSPISGIPFTIDGNPKTTSYSEWLYQGYYNIEMPATYNGYNWQHWLDGSTSRTRTVLLTTSVSLTAVYAPASSLDFSISPSPPSLTIQQGSSGSSTITATSINGFNQPIQLSVSAPSGVTATPSPSQVTPPAGGTATSTLTVSVATSATPGTYTLTVTGTSGALTHNIDVSLEITAAPPPEWTFAVITDLHIGRGYADYGGKGIDVADWVDGQEYFLTERLRNVVNWINDHRIERNIAFVAVLGDISDSGERSELMKAKSILDELTIPYIPLIGNHDVFPYTDNEQNDLQRNYFDFVFESQFEKLAEDSSLDWHKQTNPNPYDLQNYVFHYGGTEFIALDFADRNPLSWPLKGTSASAVLWDSTLTWLIENLHENQRTIIFSHHPFIEDLASAFTMYDLATIDEAIKISHANVLAEYAGHIHGWYNVIPYFMDASKIQTSSVQGVSIVTTEAVMVGSNTATEKGIIRVSSVTGDKIGVPEGIFPSLNPHITGAQGLRTLGDIRVTVKAFAFADMQSSTKPLRYFLYLDGQAEYADSKESTKVEDIYFDAQTLSRGIHQVKVTVEGIAPDGQQISETIYGSINVGFATVKLMCPADIVVTDPSGRSIGKLLNEIPGATYDDVDVNGDGNLDILIQIPAALDGNYILTLNGTGSGYYTLMFEFDNSEEVIGFNATEIPISLGLVHEFVINSDFLHENEQGAIVQVDTDGNPGFEQTFASDSELTRNEFLIQTDQIVLYTFSPVWGEETFEVSVESNSTVSNFDFSQPDKQIGFNVAGEAGIGFCNVTIPKALLYGEPWTVLINGASVPAAITENATYTSLYFTYTHSTHLIQIIGTWVIGPPPPPLSVLISPLSGSLLMGQSVTFTSTVTGGAIPYSYQWYLNGAPVAGAGSASWAFTPSTSGICSVYLNVTDAGGGMSISESAHITVEAGARVFVDPASNIFPPPLMGVGSTFVVNVTISDTSLFCGLQWKLSWDPTLLQCTGITEVLMHTVTPSYDWSNIWSIQLKYNNTAGIAEYGQLWQNIDQAIANGYGPANITMAKYLEGKVACASLTMRVQKAPTMAESLSCFLNLTSVKVSDKNAESIAVTVENELYQLNWSPPSALPHFSVSPASYTASSVGEVFNISVCLNDLGVAWEAVGFEFKLSYNSTILQLLNVYEGPWLQPYGASPNQGTLFMFKYGPDYVQVCDAMLADANGAWHTPFTSAGNSNNVPMAILTFKATMQGLFPMVLSCQLHLYNTKVISRLGQPIIQDPSINGFYSVKSRVLQLPGDINSDGLVDLMDAIQAAASFGSSPGQPNWNEAADINGDNVVDIYDLILLANNFGKSSSSTSMSSLSLVSGLNQATLSSNLSYELAFQSSQNVAYLFIDPLKTTNGNLIVGSSFAINIKIVGAFDVAGLEFKLAFNSTALNVISVTRGSFIPLSASPITQIDNVVGFIKFNASFPTPLNGDGALAVIQFQVMANNVQSTPLHLYDVALVDSGSQTLPFTRADGSFSNLKIIPGDLNHDGMVDVRDAIVFSHSFGSVSSDPYWNPEADVDANGEIDVCDLVLIVMNFGTSA